jgi:hypothetical protein
MSRAITWINKFDLSVHAAVSQTPEDRALVELLVADFTAKLKRGVKPERLIHDPLQVNVLNEVEDGRHRLLAALRIDKLVELPCDVIEFSNPAELVCEKLLQRRHYSKSARAYALRHMAAKAAQAGREASAANARAVRAGSESRFNRLSETDTLESLALKSNLSVDLLQQAVKLERDYMTRADKLIADWLDLNPDDNESWLAFRDANMALDMPWSVWRAQALAASGLPDDAKSHNTLPKHFREIEEDKIFNGVIEADGEDDDRKSYSLGAALKAMGSYFATAGQVRNDVNKDSPVLWMTLRSKIKSFGSTMWKEWSSIDQAGRIEVIKDLTDSALTWPDDVRAALFAKLSKKGGES